MNQFQFVVLAAFLALVGRLVAIEYRRCREKNERKKVDTHERLKSLQAKMENFYAPLSGNLTLFHVEYRERSKREVIDPFLKKYSIQDKYPVMASERLSELFDRYFCMGEMDIRREHGNPDDKWEALLDEIKKTIQVDYEKLKKDIARARELLRDPAIEGKFV
jgi:hypothetical protein